MSDEEETTSKRLERAKLRNENLKNWAIIAGIVLSLATSITAHFKEEEEKTAKGVYKELSTAVEKNSSNIQGMHKDLASIRGYLAGQSDKNAAASLFDIFEESEPLVLEEDGEGAAEEEPVAMAAAPEEEPERTKIGVVRAAKKPPQVSPEPEQYVAPPIEQVAAQAAAAE